MHLKRSEFYEIEIAIGVGGLLRKKGQNKVVSDVTVRLTFGLVGSFGLGVKGKKCQNSYADLGNLNRKHLYVGKLKWCGGATSLGRVETARIHV